MTPAIPVLETAGFQLTPLAVSDVRDLVAHLGDPATVEWMDLEALADLAGAEAIIAWAASLLATGHGIRWAIRDHAGAFVGTAGFNSLVRERASRGELAYDVVRQRWRQGVMAELLPALLAYGYGELGLRRIEALVTPGNTASAGLLERFGFDREATLRDYAFWKGRFWDQWLYARLADDK
jgi:[ribosomal protein S5]-alanine N-acetyltransferase